MLLRLGEGAGKGGELSNRRGVEITPPSPPLSAWGNLKPREDPHPKFFNTLPSQETGAGSFHPLCRRGNHSTVRQQDVRHDGRSRDRRPGLPAPPVLCLHPRCQTLSRMAQERRARLGSPSLGLEHWERLCKRGTPCAAARPSATCRGEQDPREGAGGLGKPLQPSRARAPGVVLRLPMLRGSGVGLDRMRPRAPAARTNVY